MRRQRMTAAGYAARRMLNQARERSTRFEMCRPIAIASALNETDAEIHVISHPERQINVKP